MNTQHNVFNDFLEHNNLEVSKTGAIIQKGKKKRQKYNNIKCDYNGEKFDSLKERERYFVLKTFSDCGRIKNMERQKRFLIVPKTKTERAAYYVADFVYTNGDGKTVIEDVKSAITRKNPVYILKRKLIKHLYPEYIFVET